MTSSSTSLSPVKRKCGKQNPWKSVVVENRSGRLGEEINLFEASDHCYHEQFMESFFSTGYSKFDCDRWSSQEWKSEVVARDLAQQICPHHGDALLDGNVQSVRCGETLRDAILAQEFLAQGDFRCLLHPLQTWQSMPRKGWTMETPNGWFQVI